MDYPEYEWEAEVRLGNELCLPERAFLRSRKRRMRAAFAELFGVPVAKIDERDLPIVAIAGSGGGYRAMVNTLGALKGAEETGILDCTSYLAGISDDGSYPMPIMTAISRHLREPLEKQEVETKKQESEAYTPTRRLRLRKEAEELEAQVRWLWFEWSPYEVGCDELGGTASLGDHFQLPCWPYASTLAWIPSWALGRRFNKGQNIERRASHLFHIKMPRIYLVDALIYQARNKSHPSLRDLWVGILRVTATRKISACLGERYFLEVRPLLRDLPLPIFNWLEGVLIENEKEFDVIHPVPPVALPNFVQGLEGQLRYGSPEGITEVETLRFMDAGAELNIPYYPLLRREVDCIIALDASADSQDLWFTRAEGRFNVQILAALSALSSRGFCSEYAARRGLRTWPKGARWPKVLRPSTEEPSLSAQQEQEADTASNANQRVANTKEADVVEQASHQQAAKAPMEGTSITKSQVSLSSAVRGEAGPQQGGQPDPHSGLASDDEPETDGKPSSAYVWIGSSTDSGPSRIDKLDEEDLASRDGIGIVYMPLIRNEEAQRRHGGHLWDPMHISTWRFELQREETDRLLTTAEGWSSKNRACAEGNVDAQTQGAPREGTAGVEEKF
ncbi:hypothetical protein FRC10_002211 [Ceratobasidium sp. 414]|nr:hypothetical protein FRC10_002211 [Ceratobasidium sp. 414]